MPYTAYNSVKQMGLVASGGAVKEQYIPLWVYSSGSVSTPQMSTLYNMVNKGSTSTTSGSTPSPNSSCKLITLSPNWSANQKFALEASLYTSNAGSYAQVGLVDFTTGSSVSYAAVSTTSTTAVLIRSGTFILIPGHIYGLSLSSTMGNGILVYLNKAHLVAID